MAVRSKEYACSRSIVGIVGSNPADNMDVLLGLLYRLLPVVQVAVSATSLSLI